jgi:hypothetical protein
MIKYFKFSHTKNTGVKDTAIFTKAGKEKRAIGLDIWDIRECLAMESPEISKVELNKGLQKLLDNLK